jgi:hypothetical protein
LTNAEIFLLLFIVPLDCSALRNSMRKTPFPENTVAAAVMEKRGEQEAWQDIALRKDRKQCGKDFMAAGKVF